MADSERIEGSGSSASESPARAAPRSGPGRMVYMDNLRGFIVILVVVFHSAVGYMVHMPPWWYVPDSRKLIVTDGFEALTDVFMMPLMMMVAGYFAAGSIGRSGPRRFVERRATRLVIPWVAGVVLCTPLITYVGLVARGARPESILRFWGAYFQSRHFHHAHYWFLGMLAVLSVCLAVWVRWRGPVRRIEDRRGPSTLHWALVVALPAAWLFGMNLVIADDEWLVWGWVVSIQPTRVGMYVAYFAWGVVAWRRGWLEAGGWLPDVRRWGALAVIGTVGVLLYKSWCLRRGEVWVLAINAVLHSAYCLTMVMLLLGWFHRHANRPAGVFGGLVRNSFGIYFIHFGVVAPMSLAAVHWDLPAAAKWLVVSVVSVSVSWCVSEFALVRLPYIRRVFA
ncbi:MAG: acyltransferase family protein [Deltaproteobacteria bacterium]|nr:acyltransferase family protein [Deltaproteobacteria bacterium]